MGGSPLLDFAATAVFALAGAVDARELAGAFAPAAAAAGASQPAGLDSPAPFR